MKIFEYLKPENPIAQWIVYVLIGMFLFWFGLLLWSFWRHLLYRSQIKRCKDVSSLRPKHSDAQVGDGSSGMAFPEPRERVFRTFQVTRGLNRGGPVSRHLRAIFEAGQDESQLDARGLIKNTTDELFRINTLHRSLLSIFIILGLLGTLFGLADTMASLDSLLRGTAQLNNVTLGQSLQRLLGTLKGAFAPSIWGVSLTVLGVLLFSFYLRLVALPLGGLLERITLTIWIPQLVPTPSQKLKERLQLSREQMERSVQATKEVTKFADDIQSKTGSLRDTLGLTDKAFKQMSQVADSLGTFSKHFEEGVKGLVGFQDDLRALYQQMKDESRVFQESVQRNIAGSEDFQQRIQGQLTSQHEELGRVLGALDMYETAYLESRRGIDSKLAEVLEKATSAFESLGHRNEEISHGLDNALGRPLRESLTQNLTAVETALDTRLGEVESTLQVQLASLGERLRALDVPLNNAATKFSDTFSNFNEATDEWRKRLHREFIVQNEASQQQLQKLEVLNEQIPGLLEQLTSSSNNFSESSSQFATHGKQLTEDTSTLSQRIDALGRSVDALSQKVVTQPNNDRAAELLGSLTTIVQQQLTRQTASLQELAQRIERLAAQSRSRPVSVVTVDEQTSPVRYYDERETRWRDRVRNWLRGR
jgi:hypothetical protein